MRLNVFLKPRPLDTDAHRLIRALVVLQVRSPEVFDQIKLGLADLLEPSLVAFLRVPPTEILAVAQGRGQVAQDVLMLIEHLDHYRQKLDEFDRAAAAKATSQPPPRQG